MARQSLFSYEHRDTAPAVLVVTSNWPAPGRESYGIFVRRQIESLLRKGVAADVLFIRGYISPRAYPQVAAHLLRRSGRASTYKVVHAHGGEASLAASCVIGRPLVVSYSGSDILGAPDQGGDISARKRLRRWVIQQNARRARAIVVKSRDMLLRLPGNVRPRAEVIPNGVDMELFAPLERTRAREALGWSPDERIVLFVADPQLPYKRFALATAACERAQSALGDVRLEVANDVPPDEMPVVMSAADCLLHPSASEGSPNVIKEAMACNLPIVATPVGDIPERLTGIDGCFVRDAEVEQLADALTLCLRTPYRTEARWSGRVNGLDEVAERLIALYERTAGSPVR